MSYKPRPGEFPDDVNTRHNETIYRCSHCGVASGLYWHKTVPGAAVCGRAECAEAIATREQKKMKTPTCPYCHGPAEMVTGDVLYGAHRQDLAGKNFWRCIPCGSQIGCHPANTPDQRGIGDGTVPMGTLANAELRRARQAVHGRLDPLWMRSRDRRGARHTVYHWLGLHMGIPTEKCHVGEFGLQDCAAAMNVLRTKKPPSV